MNNRNTKITRILFATILSMMLVLSILPIMVFAEGSANAPSKKLATNHAPKLRLISNNPAIATVNAKGKVTAKSKGKAVIYVQTINGIWKTCKITVN